MTRGTIEIGQQLDDFANDLVRANGELTRTDVGGLSAEYQDIQTLVAVFDLEPGEFQEAYQQVSRFEGFEEAAAVRLDFDRVGFRGTTGDLRNHENWEVGGLDTTTDASVRYFYKRRRAECREEGLEGHYDRYALWGNRRDVDGIDIGGGLVSIVGGDVTYLRDSCAVSNGPRYGSFERAKAPLQAYSITGAILHITRQRLS